MNMENENKLRNMLKELIRLDIKTNYAALDREYGCDYKTAKARYNEEKNKENGVEIIKETRKHIIDAELNPVINDRKAEDIMDCKKKI